MTNPYGAQPVEDPNEAIDHFAEIVTGNPSLVTRPNLVQAMASGGATRAQAAMANTFVNSLEDENTVRQLRASGQKAVLPYDMRQRLDAIGVKYDDVHLTDQDVVTQIEKAGQVPVYNNGQLVGARAKTEAEQNKGKPGWFDSAGGFFHHLTHNPVTNTASEGLNVVDETLGNFFSSNKQADEQKHLMQVMGYDPNSTVSQIAFAAKGLAPSDISSVVKQYGQDKVDAAEQYLADPAQYVQNMLAEANKQDPSGALAAQKMADLNSAEMGDVIKQVSAKRAGLGADLAHELGLDPVKNAHAYGMVSGITNLAVNLATDPTLILGRYYKLAKIASIGLKSADDTTRMARILDLGNKNFFARRVQRGMQFAVDQGNLIRAGQAEMQAAKDAGDLRAYADAEAKVASGYAGLKKVGLSELTPALVGRPATEPIAGGFIGEALDGEPLDTYDKLANYIVNTHGALVLRSGRAFIQSNLMPGSLSSWGASRLRGILTGKITDARATFNFKKLEAASKILPSEFDAVDTATGEVLATDGLTGAQAADEGQLASQMRGTSFPSMSQIGEVNYNLRRYGNFMGPDGRFGWLGKSLPFTVKGQEIAPGSWVNPVAVGARLRLAATRLNVLNVLPRNDVVNLMDEQAPAKVYAFARTYLPEIQSRMLAGSFAAGDIGAKRAIWRGLKEQVFHTAGLYHTEAGKALAEKFLSEDEHIYSHSMDGVMDVDPITGERDVAAPVWRTQNRLKYSMPGFAELHKAAAKIGLHEALLGRAMTSNIADAAGSGVRKLILTSPRTAIRATVEGWVNALARGDASLALAIKAKLGELDLLPERTKAGQLVAKFPPARWIGGWIRNVDKRMLSDQEAMYLERIADNYPHVAEQIQDSLSQHLLRGDVAPQEEAKDILVTAQAGLKPVRWEREGYSLQSVDGYAGAHRLEAALRMRQSGNPETFQALLNHIAEPSVHTKNAAIDALRNSPDEYAGFRASRWSNVYRDENGTLQRAITDDEKDLALRQHVDRMENDLRKLVTGRGVEAEYNEAGELTQAPQLGEVQMHLVDKMRGKPASTAYDEAKARVEAAQAAVRNLAKGQRAPEVRAELKAAKADFRALLSGEKDLSADDVIHEPIPGDIPDADWLHENLKGAQRPLAAIAPNYVAKVVDDEDDTVSAWQKVGSSLNDLSGKAYEALVTRPAERMTSMPVFWANYVKERVALSGIEQKLIEDSGYSKEFADQVLMERAIRWAWVRTEATVDDPGLKTQLDVVGRNFFGFPRAINAFLRRYGQLVRQDPTVIRKAVLGIQGAEQMGVLYKDPNGELTYTVPGSSFLMNGLNELGRVMGYDGFLKIPSGDISGKLLMSAPGFDNPIRPSMSPMLNIPFRFIANLFPDHREMIAEIDQALNGSKGAGRSWESTLMPAALSHLWEALDPHERDNIRASTTIGAMANLIATDPNGEKGLWVKPGSDPTGEQVQKILGHVKTQVRNQLFMRWALGLILPGAPSRPSENMEGSHPDEAYFVRGARTMSDEFKMMIDDNGGNYQLALQQFIGEHPNGLIYTMPTSTVTSAHADIPATRQSEAWMEKNLDLIHKYPNVVAYFAPPAQGKFDANAWQAQLATGLRQKKSINDFVNSYELRVAQNQYFTAYDQMKAARDQALQAGDKKRASFLSQDFTEQMKPFLAANPLMQDYLSVTTAQRASDARKGIDQLRQLVNDPAANHLVGLEDAQKMLNAWDLHSQYQANTVTNSSSARKFEDAQFGDFMTSIVASNPNMTGLYQMFRALDNKALPSLVAPGGS